VKVGQHASEGPSDLPEIDPAAAAPDDADADPADDADPDEPAPAAPAAPADSEALNRLRIASMKVASARTEAELRAAQEEFRPAANLGGTPPAAEPDEYDREASQLEGELLDIMPGETVEERRKNLAHYDKIGKLNFAKTAKRTEQIVNQRVKNEVARIFRDLGVMPEDFKAIAEMSRNQEWAPHLEKLGPAAKGFLPQAKALREKFARIGEEISHEDALLMASRGKSLAAAPAAPAARNQRGPVVPSAEDGPPSRTAAKPTGRAATNAEIQAEFHRLKNGAQPRFGIGGVLPSGFNGRS